MVNRPQFVLIALGKLPSWLPSAWLVVALVLAVPVHAREPIPASFNGRVIAIADGDTLTVLDLKKRQHRIRIAGIDAPEKRQAFGQVAKGHLSRLVFGKTVRIEARKIDQYGRRIGRVVLDGWDVGLEQIRAGFAWHFKRFQNEQPLFERVAYAPRPRPLPESLKRASGATVAPLRRGTLEGPTNRKHKRRSHDD